MFTPQVLTLITVAFLAGALFGASWMKFIFKRAFKACRDETHENYRRCLKEMGLL